MHQVAYCDHPFHQKTISAVPVSSQVLIVKCTQSHVYNHRSCHNSIPFYQLLLKRGLPLNCLLIVRYFVIAHKLLILFFNFQPSLLAHSVAHQSSVLSLPSQVRIVKCTQSHVYNHRSCHNSIPFYQQLLKRGLPLNCLCTHSQVFCIYTLTSTFIL